MLNEDVMLGAVSFGHNEMQVLIDEINNFAVPDTRPGPCTEDGLTETNTKFLLYFHLLENKQSWRNKEVEKLMIQT